MAAPLFTADALGMILFWLLALALGSGSMVLGSLGFPLRIKVPFAIGHAKQGLQPVLGESTARDDDPSDSWTTQSPAQSENLHPESKLGIAPQLFRQSGRWSQFLPSVPTRPVDALFGTSPGA
jgi:hypothetical protein